MTTKKATFRLYATDETWAWQGLPEGCTSVFGVYLMREDEGVHLCSLSPSSRLDFMKNVFCGIPQDNDFAEQAQYENGGEATTYTSLLAPAKNAQRFSAPREIEVDVDEGEVDVDEGEDVNDLLWEAARESFHANDSSIPIVEAAWAASL